MYIIFGIIAGIVTGMGMGGGTVLILLLSMFAGLDQHIAQATNLVYFVPTSISTIFINIKQKNLDVKLAVKISIFGIIGAIIGAIIADKIPSTNLRKYFAVFIFIIGLYEVYQLYKTYKKKTNKT
ncbi:MAG: TSUP family transporter [Clostridia bacterium]|nr:TSUP family transporter [Clostridia bacterium]